MQSKIWSLPDYPGELTAMFSVGNLWFTSFFSQKYRDVCTFTCFLMPLIIYCLHLIAGDGIWKRKEDVEGRVGRRKMSWVWEFWNCYAV